MAKKVEKEEREVKMVKKKARKEVEKERAKHPEEVVLDMVFFQNIFVSLI